MKYHFRLFILAVFFVPTAAWAQSPTLFEGSYTSAKLVCSYNVVPAGEDYYGEADHGQIQCRDAGVVLKFVLNDEGRHEHNFGHVKYEWEVLSETSFIEHIKRLNNGTWVTTGTILYRLEN